MNFVVENWYIIVAFMCLGGLITAYGIKFFKSPSDEQIRKVREWLVLGVTEAEQRFGSGTGKLKLRAVYDMFLTKFPWLAATISFETFSDLVDSALIEMKAMLSQNKAVQEYVGGVENSEVRRLSNAN